MKYYILYNYKSALETIVSNFSHPSMITPHPLLRVIISVLVLSNESVSDLSPRGENPCLIISTSKLLATVDSIHSTEYHFIINLKDRQINSITFDRNSAIPIKYRKQSTKFWLQNVNHNLVLYFRILRWPFPLIAF